MLQTHIESKNGLQSFIEASPEEELSPLGIASIQGQMKKMADFGRNGDIYVVHAAEGETVIPLEVLNANPRVRDLLFTQMTEMGLDPERYVVGNELNSLNPVTGAPEFFFSRIFKSVKKRVKKLRGTGVFTTLLPLLGQEIGVPGGPQFLRPGTAGSNLVWGILGEYLEQGKNFDPKKTAKRLALNLAKGVALKGGLNILRGEDTLKGIDSSYFTGEGYPSTAEQFGFGDKAEEVGARDITNRIKENIGVTTDVERPAPVIETRPSSPEGVFGYRHTPGRKSVAELEGIVPVTANKKFLEQQPPIYTSRPTSLYDSKLAHGDGAQVRTSVRTDAETPVRTDYTEEGTADVVKAASQKVDQRKQLLASLSPSEREEVLRAERRNNIAKLIYGDDLAMRRHYNTEKARQYEEANKTGLFGYKGPLGLPSLGNQLTDSKGLANVIDLAGYGTLGYLGAKKAGLLEDDYDEEEEQPDRSDLAGFVPRETGADLLAANPEKYRLPDEALDPFLFANKGGMVQKMATGGFPRRQLLVEGPGTGTSDEIPAMLSDGEFVMTNRAVEGADPSGNGDRYAGAKNLYGMMRNFEMRA